MILRLRKWKYVVITAHYRNDKSKEYTVNICIDETNEMHI